MGGCVGKNFRHHQGLLDLILAVEPFWRLIHRTPSYYIMQLTACQVYGTCTYTQWFV